MAEAWIGFVGSGFLRELLLSEFFLTAALEKKQQSLAPGVGEFWTFAAPFLVGSVGDYLSIRSGFRSSKISEMRKSSER